MATYDPPTELLARQLDSIRAQTHADWICVISDDCSSPGALRRDRAGASPATRASCSRARRAGSASTATSSARSRSRRPARGSSRWPTRTTPGTPTSSARWSPGSATRSSSTATRGSSAPTARLAADTYWGSGAQQPRRPALAAGRQLGHGGGVAVPRATCSTTCCRSPRRSSRISTTTGSASARSRWARSASSTGRSTTTCSTAARTLGHARGQPDAEHARAGPGACGATRASGCGSWRMHYFVDACRLMQFATILRAALRRPDERPQAPRAGAVRARRPPGARRSRASALRGARELARAAAARRSAREWMLAARVRLAAPDRRDRARPAAAAACGWTRSRRPRSTPRRARARPPSRACARSRRRSRRCGWRFATTRRGASTCSSRRSTCEHLFGGYIAKLNLARRLAERGPARPRRHGRPDRPAAGVDWARDVESYSGLAGLFDAVEVAFGRETLGLEVSRVGRVRRDDVVDGPHRRTPRCASSAASASST